MTYYPEKLMLLSLEHGFLELLFTKENYLTVNTNESLQTIDYSDYPKTHEFHLFCFF